MAAKNPKISIKKNDIVKVLTGREVGKEGKVLKVYRDKGTVIVEKVNFIHRHTKPSSRNRQGGIIEKEGPIHHSNLMVICPNCKRPTRIKTLFRGDDVNAKLRQCIHCSEVLDK